MPYPTRSSTKIIKDVVCRVLVVISLLLSLVSCEKEQDKVEDGVSLELAKERKANIGGVTYKLYFSIPADRSEAIMAESTIFFELFDLVPVILDFKEAKENILAVTSSDGRKVPYTFKNEHIIIQPEHLKKGRNELVIQFKAGESSLNRSDDMLYTLLVPDRCRTLMPCFDQPDIKARFKLTLKIPSRWRAVANGEPVRTEYFNDYKLYEFEETKPLSTYLFAFTVGRFSYVERYVGGRWIGIYHRETDTSKINASIPVIAREVSHALDWMENYTGIRYPFDVYNVVAIPDFQYGGMEHPGAVYYRASTMFLDRNADLSAWMKRSDVIAHETAHMWFGDYVTMRWFNDVWLKEVFAGFMSDKIMTQLYPDVNHRLNFFLNHYEPALRTDRTKGTHPILQELDNLKDAGTLYGDIIYHKAPIVMRMLEREISERRLQIGLQRYLRRWSYSNADWDELIKLLESTTGQDLQAWNEIWIKESGAPVIEFQKNGIVMTDESGKNRVWPQAVSVFWDYMGLKRTLIPLRDSLTPFRYGAAVVLPDGDVMGYGCFLPTDFSIRFLDDELGNLNDPLYRAVAWQALYEGVLHKKVKGEFFLKLCIKHLPQEKNNLVVNRTLSFLKIIYSTYLDEGSRQLIQDDLERFCINMVNNKAEGKNKKSYFNTLLSICSSPKSCSYLSSVLKGEQDLPEDVTINEQDKISIAFNLVLRDTSVYEDTKAYIMRTVKNKDLLDRFEYVYPSLSGDKQVRDSVFNALLVRENRVNEVWVEECLRWLNHPRRRMEAEGYVPKLLCALQEIQQTGDIFFPGSWLSAGLAGHTSKNVYTMVNSFLEKHANYPQNLKLKILSNSDHLRRLHSEEENRDRLK